MQNRFSEFLENNRIPEGLSEDSSPKVFFWQVHDQDFRFSELVRRFSIFTVRASYLLLIFKMFSPAS